MQTGQELMDILFSSYRIADGYFCSDWFERRGTITGGVSGAWLVLVWGVVLMLYVWLFQSMLLSIRVLLRVLDPHIFLWTRNPGRVLEL